jgi:SAM-dependent methyltransferase
MLETKFSHVPNFTGYMGIIFGIIQDGTKSQKVLDIPAGNGLLASRLRECGHQAVCADINREKPDYVFADLNERLPFSDREFDTCVCMEGIEHVLDSAALIAELCRITRPGGRIIISLPNIQNAYSRLNFLCTGYFYQFNPWSSRHLQSGEQIDRGHIAPLSYVQLRYLFQHYGARLLSVTGDRWKKKWLIPFLLPFLAIGWVWARWGLSRQEVISTDGPLEILNHLFSPNALFSRSLILVFERI